MAKLDMSQTLFLGFIVATFFFIFELISDSLSYMLNLVSPGFGFLFAKVFFILILLCTIFLILGYSPRIVSLKEKAHIKLFKILGLSLLILILLMYLEMFLVVLLK